jgi:hypothetical protein
MPSPGQGQGQQGQGQQGQGQQGQQGQGQGQGRGESRPSALSQPLLAPRQPNQPNQPSASAKGKVQPDDGKVQPDGGKVQLDDGGGGGGGGDGGGGAGGGGAGTPGAARAAGTACACIAGFLSGTMYVPVQAVPPAVDGLSYTISFGACAAALTYALLLLYALARRARRRPPLRFHLRRTLGPGLLSGLLFSAGNLATSFVAAYLSQSVGVALTNCSLLVSSAWSVFYYKEVVDASHIRAWFAAAVVTLGGIGMLGLSSE